MVVNRIYHLNRSQDLAVTGCCGVPAVNPLNARGFSGTGFSQEEASFNAIRFPA